ncbi:glutamine--fructose-6-phosphate transaminase (isomerizing), partial [Candidatus Woesebacteria bacterium]|nr:glutamine--fructose-6-phosphate transaminase (isomerizing) [Candidatus Woesebacteria bacterium]
IHNGIFENYEEIKADLVKKGHKFISETDTEVIVHLIEELAKNLSFPEAVRGAFNQMHGLNAIIAITAKERAFVAARNGSPLCIGVGHGENFLASDATALLPYTKEVHFMDDGELAVVKEDGIQILNAKNGKRVPLKVQKLNLSVAEAEKGKYPYFLLKEINEEAEVVARIANTPSKEVEKAVEMIKKAWGTYFTACGTASYAGLAATYMFASIAKRHVNFTVGSEFPYFEDFLVPKSLLIAASQSGETMDTLEAVRAAKRHRSKILAMVNAPGSSLTRLADYTIYLKAGPEKAVLSTKAYVAKLAYFLLFAWALKGEYKKGIQVLRKTATEITKMFKSSLEKNTLTLAKKLKKKDHIYLIGRGENYATALEGALKIKEVSYIHAEGFAGGELKHGVIALVEKGTPCIAIVANDEAKEAVLSNAMELRSRGGYIVGIGPKKESVFDYWIKVPDVGTASPIVNVVPLQLLGYHLAVVKGLDPDMPRNLAKSVTVK